MNVLGETLSDKQRIPFREREQFLRVHSVCNMTFRACSISVAEVHLWQSYVMCFHANASLRLDVLFTVESESSPKTTPL